MQNLLVAKTTDSCAI